MKLTLNLGFVLVVLFHPTIAKCQTTKELKTYVYYFASDDLKGRDTGSAGMHSAAWYVAGKCKEYGLSVSVVPVGGCKNVVAQIEGKNLTKTIVIGAHLDHIGIRRGRVCNGADDNASGSAAVLGLAKRFSAELKPNYTITFIWFTGEECGFLGSKHYIKSPRFSTKEHVFMLNLDMIGRLNRSGSKEPIDVPIILRELYEKYPFASDITFRADKGSDQIIFAPHMPVVFLHTGLHSDYHKPGDDADKINYEGMIKICNYAYDLVNKVLGKSNVDDYILYGLPIYSKIKE